MRALQICPTGVGLAFFLASPSRILKWYSKGRYLPPTNSPLQTVEWKWNGDCVAFLASLARTKMVLQISSNQLWMPTDAESWILCILLRRRWVWKTVRAFHHKQQHPKAKFLGPGSTPFKACVIGGLHLLSLLIFSILFSWYFLTHCHKQDIFPLYSASLNKIQPGLTQILSQMGDGKNKLKPEGCQTLGNDVCKQPANCWKDLKGKTDVWKCLLKAKDIIGRWLLLSSF